MRKKLWINLALLLVIPGLLFTVSCAKKTVMADAAVASDTGTKADATQSGPSAEELAKQAAMRKAEMERQMFMNEDLYFDYDKSDLKMAAQDVLKRKAVWLRNNPGESVIIEGHCDERGTNEYNLALGDRRAESAKKFLMDLGIPGSRMTTISYGEERPVDMGQTEESYAKNRRAHFLIQ